MSAAREILRRLSAVGAHIECRRERVVLCAGDRPVPTELIKAARQAKTEFSKVLKPVEDAQTRTGEHLRCVEPEKPRNSAALVEDAQMSAFDEHLPKGSSSAQPEDALEKVEHSNALTEDAHPKMLNVSFFDKTEDFCGFQASRASKVLTSPHLSTFGENEHPRCGWAEAEAARAAIIEDDGGVPRAWAEGFARLDPDRPPSGVPPHRWQRFVDDVGVFLDRWAAYAAALGWGPHDLFGCDRDRPFARIDQAGLLWLLNGDRLLALTENTAAIETGTGARQTYRRKPFEPELVLAWELADDID